jgi:hypothetical protein
MSKDFYLGLIPIGDYCNWRKVLDNIAMTTILHDKAYRCLRYFDSLESKKYIDDEPVFFPNEAINLEGDIKFRVAISSPLYFSDNSKNYIPVMTPWHDENIIYKDASWFGVDKIIKDHSNYILIIRQDYSRLGEYYNENNDYIKRVADICDKYNKVYKVINHNDSIRYNDIYKYFLE